MVNVKWTINEYFLVELGHPDENSCNWSINQILKLRLNCISSVVVKTRASASSRILNGTHPKELWDDMTVGAREDLFAIQAKDHDRLIGRVLAGNLYLFLTSI